MCSGASVVTSGDRTIKGYDLSIELAGGRASVFIVNPEGTLSLGESRGFDSWKPDSDLPHFAEQLPDVDLNLKNKSPREASPQTKGPRD
ncbi:MAG: hypothetical protein Q7S40_10335 [Opitutaceae bacterium]|nr:hypothetical protein [Opitutaceae bacterium]